MPRQPIDYSKTIIYKIQHEDKEELVYVGHTTAFNTRKNRHKTTCNNEKGNHYNLKVYQMIRANGGWDCFKMVMIEEYPCSNLLEACKREDECMRQLKATMNSYGAVLNKEKRKEYDIQYYEEHKEKIKENTKQYREANKEEYKQKNKQYYEENKEYYEVKAKQYREANKEELKEYAKQYYEANKEERNEKAKQYREANKEKINRRRREANKEKINRRRTEQRKEQSIKT
jgi:hypothetical protein